MKVNVASHVSVICYANTRGPPTPSKPFKKRFEIDKNCNSLPPTLISGKNFEPLCVSPLQLLPQCVIPFSAKKEGTAKTLPALTNK